MPVVLISASTAPALGPARPSATISSGVFAATRTAARVLMQGLVRF
jgi:hypothetical protein